MVATVSSSTTTTASTLAATGSSIISSLTSSSGVDNTALINKLVDVSQAAESQSLTTKQTNLQTQISDWGLLKSAFSTLQSAASPLSSPDTFSAKSVNVPNTNLLSISKLTSAATAGQYAITVDQLAQSQSLTSTGYGSQTAPIGKGTINIQLGTWDNTGTSFTADSTKTGATITIDDSNNSLQGLRDSINKAGLGLTATIVTNNNQYQLLVTSPSGASNEIALTATEDGSAPGLSSFNFNNSSRSLTQLQSGADSKVHVNGMSFTRSSNHLTDVITGLEIDLNNSSTTETVNIGVTNDTTVADKAIRDFVTAYNTFLTSTNKLVGLDPTTNTYGSLHTDSLAKNLIRQVKAQFGSAITGASGNFTSFSSLGIRTNINDGSLQIDESTNATSYTSALANNFDAVRDLFIPKTSSTNAQINVTKFSAQSVPGSYAVNITNSASKGILTGAAATFPNDSTAKSYSFTMSIDGTATNSITLPAKNYASGAALAADLQTAINADANITAAKVGVNVVFNTTTQKLEFTSRAYGSTSKVDMTAASADMADFGLATATGVPGSDVAGTVDGKAAFGYGNVLLPALGSNAEGLSMQIDPGATTGTITYSQGFATTFTNLLDNFLKTNGLIDSQQTDINKNIDDVKTQLTDLGKRSDSYRTRLQAQFAAMENIVRSLKTTGTFLSNAFKTDTSSSSGN